MVMNNNKLEEIFEEITSKDLKYWFIAEDCADKCKEIAVSFLRDYVQEGWKDNA